MSTNAIVASVLIDGLPVCDGSNPNDTSPTVLSGLRITWGRDSAVDQSAPAACSFTIDDPLTGVRLTPSLTIGRTVDVEASTVIYPDPNVSTIAALWPTGLVNVASVVEPVAGTNVLVEGGQAGRAMYVVYPPAKPSTDPTAWDLVPRTLPGQEWRVSATVGFPPAFCGWNGYEAAVWGVMYTRPDGDGLAIQNPAVATPASPVASALFLPPPGVWLGVQVSVWPTGPVWDDLDGTTWDAAGDMTWDDLARFTLSAVDMFAPAAGAAQVSKVFSGRITDLEASWNGGASTTVKVIAQGWLAELENRFVGAEPWPLESLGVRAQRVVALSGQPVELTVDPALAALPVTWRDVDNQSAGALLNELTVSSGGVMWSSTHMVTGQRLWLEDLDARPAALTLSAAGGLVHVVPAVVAASLPVSACLFDVDPVRLTLDASTTASTVAVQWMQQGVNEKGEQAPKQMTEEIVDPAVVERIGVRRVSVSTQLAAQADARELARAWLARLSELAWRLDGLVWDTEQNLTPADTSTVMTLLDGIRRVGLPINLTDFPVAVFPLGVDLVNPFVTLYIEGGTYTYNAGAWRLELTTSSAKGSAVGTLPWDALDPAWTWDDMDPDMTWIDLYGVTYP